MMNFRTEDKEAYEDTFEDENGEIAGADPVSSALNDMDF